MSCMKCFHAHILSHSPTPSHMPMPSVTTVTGSTNDTHMSSPYRLTSTQCKCQWSTNPESIPTLITQLEDYVITITVCILFGQQSFSDYTAGLLHPHKTFRITPQVSYTRKELLAQATSLLHPYRTFEYLCGSLTPIQKFSDISAGFLHPNSKPLTCGD